MPLYYSSPNFSLRSFRKFRFHVRNRSRPGDAGEARRFLGETAHAISSLDYCRGVGLGCGVGRALGVGVGLVGRRRINGLNEFTEAQIV